MVGDPPDHLLQPGQGRRPVQPADLDVGRAALYLLVRGVGGRRGMDTTSCAPGTALTASVSVCANVNCVSNDPPDRSSRPYNCRA